MPLLYSADVAQRTEGGDRGGRDGGRLLNGEGGRLRRELVFSRTRVFGAGTLARTEHRIARLESRNAGADRLHLARHVMSWNAVRRLAQAGDHADGQRSAPDAEAVTHVQARRAHAYQYLVVLGHGPVDVPEFEDIGRAVGVVHNGLHSV